MAAADGRAKGDDIRMDHDTSHRIAIAAIAVGLAFAPVAVPAVTLAALTVRDELGYTCIPEILLEAAYRADGKGAILPQTCLPEPCRRQISEQELAMLMGRPPRAADWDGYVARYAEYCVAETGGAWYPGAVADISDASYVGINPVGFWAPFVLPPAIPVAQLRDGPSSAGGALPQAIPTLPFPNASIGPRPIPDAPETPVEGDLPVVPLPAALWLLLGAFGVGALVRRFA